MPNDNAEKQVGSPQENTSALEKARANLQRRKDALEKRKQKLEELKQKFKELKQAFEQRKADMLHSMGTIGTAEKKEEKADRTKVDENHIRPDKQEEEQKRKEQEEKKREEEEARKKEEEKKREEEEKKREEEEARKKQEEQKRQEAKKETPIREKASQKMNEAREAATQTNNREKAKLLREVAEMWSTITNKINDLLEKGILREEDIKIRDDKIPENVEELRKYLERLRGELGHLQQTLQLGVPLGERNEREEELFSIRPEKMYEGNFLRTPEQVYRVDQRENEYGHAFSPVEKRLEFELQMDPSVPRQQIINYFNNASNIVAEMILQETGMQDITRAIAELKKSPDGKRKMIRYIATAFLKQNCVYNPEEKLKRAFNPRLWEGKQYCHLDCNLLTEGFMHIAKNLGFPIYMTIAPDHAYAIWKDREDFLEIEATAFRDKKRSEDTKEIVLLDKINDDILVMEKGAHASRTSLTGYGQALAINEGYFEPITDDRALADFVHGTLWSQEIVEQFGVANEDAKALPHAEEVQRKYVAFAETSHHNWVYTQGLATHLSLGVIYIKHKQFEKAEEIARRADAYFQKHREHLVDAEKDKIEAFRRDIQAARSREQLDRSNLDQRLLQVLLDRRINQNELSDDAKENLRALNTQLNTYAQRILAGGADAEKAMTEIVEETRQRRDYTANALIAETCTFVLDNNPALKKNLQRSLLEKIRVILHEMAEEYDKNNELYDSGRVIVGFLEMLKDKNHGVRNATASIKGAETLMLVRVFWRVREYGEQ